MLNEKDVLKFSLTIYDTNGMPLPETYIISRDINLSFKLPENTGKVEIKEYGEICNKHFRSTILTIYLGKSDTMTVIYDDGWRIYDNDPIDLRTANLYSKRVLFEETNNVIQIKKVLADNEKAIDNLDDLEKYIRRFSCLTGSLLTQTEKVRQLIKEK